MAGELGGKDQTGTVRETFFAHQLKSAGVNVRIPSRGDFLVEGRYLFELGGRTKGKSQVKDADNAFVVRDEIEVGFGNTEGISPTSRLQVLNRLSVKCFQ